jgi:hypothetical protein
VTNALYGTCFNRRRNLGHISASNSGVVINLFGTSLRSSSFGNIGIFCGAVLVGFAFVRSRRS